MIASLAIYLAIMSIGVLTSRVLLPDLDIKENLLIGSCIGLVLGIYVGAVTAYLGLLNTVGLWTSLFVCGVIVSVIAIRQERKNAKTVPTEHDNTTSGETLALITVLAISSAIRIALQYFSELPIGADPPFHCLIAEIIVMKGAIPTTWTPFEQIPLNYAWGSHMLLALANLTTGDPIHHAFRVLLLISTCASVYGVYLISLKVFANKMVALWGAFAYGFLSNFGGLDYNRWGGLPNAFGMLLLLAAILIFLDDRIGFARRTLIGGFVLSGIVLSHGHAMLVALLVFSSYAVLYTLASRSLRNSELRDIASMIAAAFCFSSFYSVPLVLKIQSFGETLVIWPEPYMSFIDFPRVFGELLLFFALFGLGRLLSEPSRGKTFILAWIIGLLYGFLACEYGIRFYYILRFQQSTSGFTPSRFPTDMAYPLAIAAGAGLIFLYRKLAYLDASLLRNSRHLKSNFRSLFIIGLLGYPYAILSSQWGWQYVPAQAIEACNWIKMNTPENSLIVNDPEAPGESWVAYLTLREVMYTTIPVSEHVGHPSITWKRHLGNTVFAFPEKMNETLRGYGDRPIYVYTARDWGPPQTVHLTEVFKNKKITVYQVTSR